MMKKSKVASLVLVAISIFVFAFSGCTPEPTPPRSTAVVERTNLGFVRTTDKVKNPSNEVLIEVISEGKVASTGYDSLTHNKTLVANSAASVTNVRQAKVGDVIRLTADYCYITVEMLGLAKTVLYSPTGEFVFQVPATGNPNWQRPYPTATFSGASTTISATVSTAEEIAAERNLALNPYDYHYVNELNVLTQYDQTPDGSLPEDSVSVESGEVLAYPHAYANRITTGDNRPSFLPRNAIDGDSRTGAEGGVAGHINYGAHSWGGGRRPRPSEVAGSDWGFYEDLTFVLYFGREVTLTELSFVMRADYAGTLEHDTNFTAMTAEFSDGTSQELTGFIKGAQKQTREIHPVKTTYVRLKDFERNLTDISENWTAITEFEAFGYDLAKNEPATKTTVVNTFGNKELTYTTNEYSADDIKEVVDFASADVREFIKTRSPAVTDSWWIDGVLFSAIMDAYTTTGTLDQYLMMQESFDRFQYLTRAVEASTASRNHYGVSLSTIVDGYTGPGEASDYADDYLIGETYLLMNDLRPSANKVFASYANADANMLNEPSWNKNFNANSPGDTFNWWWCDAVYMGLNYFTLMSNATDDPAYIERAYRTYVHWRDILACFDHTENNVPHGHASHGGDWALWHRDDGAGNIRTNDTVNNAADQIPTFWARGNAWVFAGLAKQLLYLDEREHPEAYALYKNDLIAMAKTLKEYQREDGSWRASVVDPTHNDGKEATGTSGFVYGLAIGVQLGILPASEYMDVIVKGFDQLLDMRIQGHATIPDGRLVYMQAVGWNAALYPGEQAVSTMTNSFGYGLFIHAAAAVMRMCDDYQAPELSVPADSQYGVLKVPAYNGVKE